MYLHDLDPFAIQLTENFGLRWYGLSYLTGFFLGYLLIRRFVRKDRCALKLEQISDFVFTVAIGTIIGGRLGYCIFYSPDLLVSITAEFPFWGVVRLQEGGMASHGGIAGVVLSAMLYAYRHNLSKLHLIDLCTFGGALGIFFGRLANFVNGELVGRVARADLTWAVKFPQDILLWPSKPELAPKLKSLTPVVEHLGVTPSEWAKMVQNINFSSANWDQVMNILNRIIIQIQSGDSVIKAAIEPLLSPRHPYQLYAALLEGLAVFIVLWLIWLKKRKPGVITASFFSVYAVMRIFTEEFRVPDAHIGFQLLGLTRGQWLSIVLLAIGLLLLTYWSRRKVDPI